MIDFTHANLNVAVIMGGVSAERQISLLSGDAVIKALLTRNIKAQAIDGVKQLLATDMQEFDVVFNILHGEAGENGELAGILSGLNIKYTGCNILGAVLSWHKNIAKTIVSAHGLKTPKAQILKSITELNITDDGPWIIKPTTEGSSVGLYYATDIKELTRSIKLSLTTVDSVLVEKFINGTECTVAIIQDQVLPVVRIQPAVGLYDYQAKYQSKTTKYFCPSSFADKLEQALKDDAMTAFEALGLKGWARIDFIVDDQGNRWFLEANTTPGLTRNSLVPKAAAAIGWSFNDLIIQILSTAFEPKS
ncbi:D-alanine--D-alanine ligase [hydrothermal vent metagenome]|uniref:D-alanine--D-alanine ligase n=1 Tax=hydrothermal vent metagenome TaxID=652676 RepID=A0A3B0VQF8_9ZZZZ